MTINKIVMDWIVKPVVYTTIGLYSLACAEKNTKVLEPIDLNNDNKEDRITVYSDSKGTKVFYFEATKNDSLYKLPKEILNQKEKDLEIKFEKWNRDKYLDIVTLGPVEKKESGLQRKVNVYLNNGHEEFKKSEKDSRVIPRDTE